MEHKHTLNDLWDAVEARGERIGAVRDRNALEALTLYGGRLKYESPAPETDPVEIWNDTRLTGQDLLAHAQERVPKLVEQTLERLQQYVPAPPAEQGPAAPDGEAEPGLKPPDMDVLSGKKSGPPSGIPKRPSAQALDNAAGTDPAPPGRREIHVSKDAPLTRSRNGCTRVQERPPRSPARNRRSAVHPRTLGASDSRHSDSGPSTGRSPLRRVVQSVQDPVTAPAHPHRHPGVPGMNQGAFSTRRGRTEPLRQNPTTASTPDCSPA